MKNLFKIYNYINKSYKYIFYSESVNYLNSYKDFIIKLADQNKNEDILHLVSDSEKNYDSLISIKNIKTINIGIGTIRTLIFPFLKGQYLFMTLTNLGNYYLKKSINCQKYVYFFHSLASIERVYEHDAFKNYEIICCNGPYQKNKIVEQEIKYNFNKKELYETGFLYLDYLNKKINFNKKEKNTILLAPSWNENKKNLFNNYSLAIIEALIKRQYKVILRPHPEHFKRSNLTINQIKKKFSHNSNFFLSKDLLDLDSLEKSCLLITDFSGISIEFMATLKRPVILLEIGEKIFNKDWNNQNKLFEDTFKDTFAVKQRGEEKLIERLLKNIDLQKNRELDEEKILEMLNNNLYNFGNVAESFVKYFK